MTQEEPTREELRRRLRGKIATGRAPASRRGIPEQIQADPVGAMLSMGIDDASVLSMAGDIARNPRGAMQAMQRKAKAGNIPAPAAPSGQTVQQSPDEEEEEDVPPPILYAPSRPAEADSDEEDLPPLVSM